MAALQQLSWESARGLFGDTVAMPDATTVARAWERAVMLPPTARHTVWVATAATTVVGLAAMAPGADPDLDPEVATELLLLTIDPRHLRQGHGSRLLAATMDSLIDIQQSTAVTWVAAQDDGSRQFLERAGWGVDGAHRSLAPHDEAPPTDHIRQLRLGTDLTPADQQDDR